MMASRAARKKRMAQATQPMASRGLTIMDANAAYNKGYEKGYDAGLDEGIKNSAMLTVHRAYGAILLAAHELFGFGQKRGIRLLNRFHTLLIETLTEEELNQRVLDEIGVEIDWEEPVENAKPKKPMKKKN